MNKDDFYSKQVYCDQLFIDFVRNKYKINDVNLTNNHQLLLLIYSYEWFNHKSNYAKMLNHPYLKTKDYNDIRFFKKVLNCIIFSIGIMGILYFRKRKIAFNDIFYIRKSFFRFFSISTALSFIFIIKNTFLNLYISTYYLHYTNLDLDKEKIKKGLIKSKILNFEGKINEFSDSSIDSFIQDNISREFDNHNINLNFKLSGKEFSI